MNKQEIIKAIEELRKFDKKKFNQSLDIIVNLKSFDVKKDSVNLFLNLPYKVKDVKIAGFLNRKSSIVDSIMKAEFDSYKDKKKVKKLVKNYDFFVSAASLMPQVATIFGKYLGPAGKMPSPQLGIVKDETENEIKEITEKFEKIVRVKSKEPSLKFCIGKENMKDEELAENIEAAYNAVVNALPRKKENLKSVMIKFSMTKALKIGI